MASEERAQRIRRIAEEALSLPDPDRASFLEAHCPPEIRVEVDELLARFEAPTHSIFEPVPQRLERLESEETQLASDEVIGRYRIIRRLGAGGMAVVYLAQHTDLHHFVALKVLPHAFTQSDERVARFKQEAITVAQLNYPSIVAVHDVGKDRGVHYIVMDFIDGPTLATRFSNAQDQSATDHGRTMRSEDYLHEMASLIAKIADALHYTHQHDIVHRDVKPNNILLDEQGEPHLTDFGIAKNLESPGLTATGQLAGTVPYMSPEQARALSRTIDPRSDIFSLGVVLYEALTLQQPFQADSIEQSRQNVIHKHPTKVRQINSGVGRDLETICHKALDKDRDHRYQTAAHLAGDLRCYVDGKPIMASPPTLARRGREWVREHKVQSLSAATLLLLLAVTALVLFEIDRQRRQLCLITVALTEPRTSAMAVVRRTDPATFLFGSPRDLGLLPIERRFPPGHYRFTITTAAGEFAEVSVLAGVGATRVVEVAIPPAGGPASDDMLFVDGSQRVDDVSLPDFYIDRHEVSNADYQRFLQSTGNPPTELWRRIPYDPIHGDLPVVGVSWEEAQAYARWVGKRLPTTLEWECAMRGPDGRLLPWADMVPDGLPSINSIEQASVNAGRNLAEGLAEYARHTRPVDSNAELATPSGIFHAATNVREYTDSTIMGTRVITRGASWLDLPEAFDLTVDSNQPIEVPVNGQVIASWSLKVGFRCARSAQP